MALADPALLPGRCPDSLAGIDLGPNLPVLRCGVLTGVCFGFSQSSPVPETTDTRVQLEVA